MKRVHLSIAGKVQGVWFRYSVERKAKKLNLHGWVRNTTDGKVEVMAEGKETEVKALIEYCKQGPPLAKVTKVEVKELPYKGQWHSFQIKRE